MPEPSTSPRPLVSVIIPSWNGAELLREFMPSVMSMRYPRCEVIVVDNNSSDGSAEFLAGKYPTVRVIRNVRNDGTAEGSNVGAREATGKYLFFISNDMWLDPDVLAHLVSRLESGPDIGICTVKMRRITAAGEMLSEIDSVGADADVFGFPGPRGINEQDKGQWDAFADVFFSFGGAMFVRRNVFDAAGMYDPEFFTLTDDIDLSWRVRLLGYRVCVEPRAFLYHRVSATLDSPAFKRARRRFWSERNTLRMLLKNYSPLTLAMILPGAFCLLAMEMAFWLCRGHGRVAVAVARAVGWNIVHLPGTLALRSKTQGKRVVSDVVILKAMKRTSYKLRMFADFLRRGRGSEWRAFFGDGTVAAGEGNG